jgi:hypothetical protein
MVYFTLVHVGGGNRCGANTVEICYDTRWLTCSLIPMSTWKVSCRRLHGTGVVVAVPLIIPLGNQAAPRCMEPFNAKRPI